MAWAVVCPSNKAASMARPETPITSDATDANLMLASSSTARVPRAAGAGRCVLHPIDQGRAFADKRAAKPGEIAQVALRHWRDETGAQQTVPQQVRQPFRVTHISLTARHGFDVLRIHQQHVEIAFQDIEHWLPVFTGALHRDMGHPITLQPVRQRQQVHCHRAKCPCLTSPATPVTGDDDAHHDGLLPMSLAGGQGGPVRVDVSPSAARIDDVHRDLPFLNSRLGWTPEKSKSDLRALGQQLVVLGGVRVRLLSRLRAPVTKPTSGQSRLTQVYHIFMGGGVPHS